MRLPVARQSELQKDSGTEVSGGGPRGAGPVLLGSGSVVSD